MNNEHVILEQATIVVSLEFKKFFIVIKDSSQSSL